MQNLLIGSYSEPNTDGIYIGDKAIKAYNPSYLLLNPPYLYAVSESENGQIACYDYFGSFELVKTLSTLGKDPCHISIDRNNKFLLVTNYSSSSIVQYFLINGKLDLLTNFILHQGSSTDPDRQTIPHPHCSLVTPDNKIYFITDLGNDTVYYYDFEENQGKLDWNQQKSLKLVGYGPRHLSLGNANQKLLYLSCELNSKVVVISYDQKLTNLFQVSTSQSAIVRNYPSQIKYFAANQNRYVVVANRGDNNFIIYKVNKNGSLSLVLIQQVYEWPRHLNLNSSNQKIVVANQNGSVVSEYSFQNEKCSEIRKKAIKTPSFVQYI